MSSALRFEWVRLRTLRSTYWLVGIGLLITAGVAFIIAYATRNEPLDADIAAQVLTGGADFATFIPVFTAIIGIFSTGHEYRHGTIQPTLTAIPQRSRLLIAKIIMVSLCAVVVVALSLVINLAIGMIFWGEVPSFGEPLNEVIPGYFVLVVLYGICGLALAQLFRGVPSAIVVLLVTPLLVEGLISGLSLVPALDWLQPALKFLPFSAGARLLATGPYDPQGGPDFDFLSRWASGGVFAAFVAIILAVAWYLFKKRDA
ncbi:ABC transporter permease [Jiangella ureilytica]|uniref:ABC transporter permease n=1 Tax=Jiangella ureilytica TaxID=2530374 RepID=A0A4R4S665_9ACTN|nr:ABC transporter permease [Jiangella ureilytica]TDC56633.1 ABC transporter permease [Jiangella ureilytica]